MRAALAAVLLVHSWYPPACCGVIDCRPVACDQIVETDHGWKYLPTGHLFMRENVWPSQDRYCHICIASNGAARCAFVQQGA